eukprot:TRINITY_DN3069_c0_g1_i2.p1 TRINITY_DN3069_c0_g1~~TRINITY_DN3069_c0_g1_i2.p1  ORF type:complete len:316 (+),score=83.51 TRINITY_DN3069_c0_g1_i2:421-1368(+)
MEKLMEQYKSYDGVCEVFTNDDLDSLKPGKITTGCSVVQRKQGVSIPITKKEVQPKAPSAQSTPVLPHPIPSKPEQSQFNMGGNISLPVFPPLGSGNFPPLNQGSTSSSNMNNMLNRKRKSIPGGWMSGLTSLNDFPNLGFQGQPIAQLRTPPGPNSAPSFALAPPDNRLPVKNPSSPIPPPPSDVRDDPNVKDLDAEFQFAKKQKTGRPKAPPPDDDDQTKLGFFSRNNAFTTTSMSFLMGDPLSSNSPGINLEQDMHDSSFYRFQDSLPKQSDTLGWMGSGGQSSSSGPSFALASGHFNGISGNPSNNPSNSG